MSPTLREALERLVAANEGLELNGIEEFREALAAAEALSPCINCGFPTLSRSPMMCDTCEKQNSAEAPPTS